MRIEHVNLTGFGRFRGLRLDLGPGLNIIWGPNESGKSTLQAFLLGMLYGQKKPGLRRDYAEEAYRYQPWHGGEYRGSLTYALANGRRYRVERQFDPGRESVRLFDAVTGAEVTSQYPQDRRKELLFAEAHLGLDQEAFRSTAWAGQLAVGRVPAGRELLARVANLQESGREDLSVQAALAHLEEQMKAIGSERTPARPYGRVLKAIAETRGALERAEVAREQMRGWEARQAELQAVLAELEADLDRAQRRVDLADLADLESRLKRTEEAAHRVREYRAQATALSAYAAFPAESLGPLRRLQAEVRELAAAAEPWRGHVAVPPSAGAPPVWWALAAAVLLVGAVLFSPWVAVGAVLCGGLWFRAWTGWQQEQARRGARVREAEEAQRRLAALEQQRATALAQVNAILAEAGVESAEAFEEGAARHQSRQRALAEADTLEAGLRTLLEGQTPEVLVAEIERLRLRVGSSAPRPDGTARAELRRLEARRSDVVAQLSDVTARLETALRDVPDTADLKRELAALAEEKQGLDDELAALELAKATIAEVADEMHRDFAPRLNHAMARVAAELTGGRYDNVRVDQEAAIRVLGAGERTVDMAMLSGGAADQVYLAFRLALLELLLDGGESVPLLLDDPFVQNDDERAEGAIAWLGRVARERQVVLLTCHGREVETARASGLRFDLIDLADAARE